MGKECYFPSWESFFGSLDYVRNIILSWSDSTRSNHSSSIVIFLLAPTAHHLIGPSTLNFRRPSLHHIFSLQPHSVSHPSLSSMSMPPIHHHHQQHHPQPLSPPVTSILIQNKLQIQNTQLSSISLFLFLS